MPAPRKPKKVLVQFAVALLVAVVFGVVAVVVGFTIITGVTHQAQIAKEEAEKRTAEVELEKKRLKADQESQHQTVKTYKVVQAIINLEPGQPITQDMITLITTPDHPPMGTLNMLSQALGKMVKSPIIQGEPLDNSKLLDAGGYIIVKDGMRAVCISVDLIGGLNGALVPGSHVDILTSVKEGEQLVTHTLLQNVQVATIGVNSTGMGGHPPSAEGIPVTVLVTPHQAQKLTLASGLGVFRLTLRNFKDTRNLAMPTEDLTGLMTGLQPGSGLTKTTSKHAKSTSTKGTGFHNVNYSSEAANLPSPLDNTPAKSKYSMQIYRGTGSESVDFQQ